MKSAAFERPESLPPSSELSRQVELVLRVARQLGETDLSAALTLTEKAIALTTRGDWDQQPLDHQLAESFHLQGTLFLNLAEYRTALVCFSKAQSLYDALEDLRNSAIELYYIGVAQAYVGLYPDALRNMFEAMAGFELEGDSPLISRFLNGIGYTYVVLNEPGKALPYLIESERIARQTNTRTDLANVLDSLGKAHLALRELDRALQCSLESVTICREVGALIKEAEYLLGLGSVYIARHDIAEADRCFRESLAIARRYGYRFAEAGALRSLGQVCKLQEQTDSATALIREALAIVQKIELRQETYECLSDLAAVAKEAGNFKEALNYYEQYHTAREAVFNEQTEFRLKSLEITYELKQATKEKEIYFLKNVALQREIEQRVRAQASAERLAIVDSLTGLFNRRHLFSLAERQLAEALRHQQPLSVVMFDIDHFKKVNDNYGHAAGDKVLSILSSSVERTLRRSDSVGRYGGEEFVVLLPQTDLDSAHTLAERLRTEIAELAIDLDHDRISVTISAGVAGLPAPQPDDRIDRLIDRADQALYLAKQNGRNRTEVYQEDSIN
jgi:diguanylate cyclase (GGDEF)-like protein